MVILLELYLEIHEICFVYINKTEKMKLYAELKKEQIRTNSYYKFNNVST